MSARRWLRVLVGLVVAGLFLTLLLRGVDWAEVRPIVGRADWWPLALGLAALAADLAARTVRWWLMLRAVEPDLRLASCVRPFLGSLALNNTMPLRAGDMVRVFGFRHALRAPAAHVAGTLILERMLDLLVLLAILFLALLGSTGHFPHGFLLAAGGAGFITILMVAALTAFPGAVAGAAQRVMLRLFSGRSWAPAANRAVTELTAALGLLRSPGRAVQLVVLSLAAWLLEGAVFACVAWSLQLLVPWAAPWLALSAATLATLLPSSPGYIGTFDYFAALGLSAYGAAAAGATAFAVLSHLMLWLPVTAVGLAMLALGGRGLRPSSAAEPLQADGRVPA